MSLAGRLHPPNRRIAVHLVKQNIFEHYHTLIDYERASERAAFNMYLIRLHNIWELHSIESKE